MSYFSGVTFAEQHVTPADDAIVAGQILGDGILKGCGFSYSGTTLTMDAGQLILCGRSIRHTAADNWAVVDAVSGFARLVLTIDLTRSASKDFFDQIQTEIQYATSEAGFAALVQEDINERGTKYQAALCVVSLGSGGITGILSHLPSAASGAMAKLGGVSMATAAVSLAAGSWSGKSQTVNVSGVTEDSAVIAAPDPASHTAYYEANVRCTAQGAGTLTFACDTVPSSALAVNVLILGRG